MLSVATTTPFWLRITTFKYKFWLDCRAPKGEMITVAWHISVEKLMLLSDDYIVYTGHNISTTIGSERVRNRYLRKKRT